MSGSLAIPPGWDSKVSRSNRPAPILVYSPPKVKGTSGDFPSMFDGILIFRLAAAGSCPDMASVSARNATGKLSGAARSVPSTRSPPTPLPEVSGGNAGGCHRHRHDRPRGLKTGYHPFTMSWASLWGRPRNMPHRWTGTLTAAADRLRSNSIPIQETSCNVTRFFVFLPGRWSPG